MGVFATKPRRVLWNILQGLGRSKPSSNQGFGRGPFLACSALVLVVGLGLRCFGLGWGIPRHSAELALAAPYRGTFHPDEDKVLMQALEMRFSSFSSLRPTDHTWGPLYTYAMLACWEGSAGLGFLGRDWRAEVREGNATTLRRVYLVSRLASVVPSMACVLLVWLTLWRRSLEPSAVLFGTSLLAFSPLLVTHAHYATSDSLLALFGTSISLLGSRRPFVAAALAGAATATKLTGLLFVPGLLRGRAPRTAGTLVAFWFAAVILFNPFVFETAPAVFRFFGNWGTLEAGAALSPDAVSDALWSLFLGGFWLLYYGLGAGLLLALSKAGRHGLSPCARTIGALILASMVFARFPMSRYVLPLIPIAAMGAGFGLTALSPVKRGVAWLFGPLWGLVLSLAMVGSFQGVHPTQKVADWISREAGPGSSVASIFRFYPLLDERIYGRQVIDDPYGTVAGTATLPREDLLAIDGLVDMPLRPDLLAFLRSRYALAMETEGRLSLLGVSAPEPLSPHDWRYSHPSWQIWTRRPGE